MTPMYRTMFLLGGSTWLDYNVVNTRLRENKELKPAVSWQLYKRTGIFVVIRYSMMPYTNLMQYKVQEELNSYSKVQTSPYGWVDRSWASLLKGKLSSNGSEGTCQQKKLPEMIELLGSTAGKNTRIVKGNLYSVVMFSRSFLLDSSRFYLLWLFLLYLAPLSKGVCSAWLTLSSRYHQSKSTL